jgi:hypothetical protein
MDRRHFLAAAAAGAFALSIDPLASQPANAAPAPKLPWEVSRVSNVTTSSSGRKLYDSIEVDIRGDRARIYLPQTIKPGGTTPVGAVWFYHGAGSDHNHAMAGGFKYPAELVVDQGAIAICLNAGGSEFSSEFAQQCQKNGWAYMSNQFRIRQNFLRATSGGGTLAIWTQGKKLMPYIKGLYLVNGNYDLEKMVTEGDPIRAAAIASVFDFDPVRIAANNPARIPASAFTGANVKVVVSDPPHTDTTVPPADHGLAFANKIRSVAADSTVATHALGHTTPTWTHKDTVLTFGKWSSA